VLALLVIQVLPDLRATQAYRVILAQIVQCREILAKKAILEQLVIRVTLARLEQKETQAHRVILAQATKAILVYREILALVFKETPGIRVILEQREIREQIKAILVPKAIRVFLALARPITGRCLLLEILLDKR
jgi:predicted transposase YdaD